MLPCTRCGDDTLSIVEIEHAGEVVFWAYVCRDCRARTDAELAPLRARFDELVAAGVSQKTATEVMRRWFVR